jgi:hypothetical protein
MHVIIPNLIFINLIFIKHLNKNPSKTIYQARKLFNPVQNGWDQSTTPVTISADGLTALNVAENSEGYVVTAVHAFPVDSAKHCRLDNFPGTIIYYFEVKQRTFGQ